MATTIVAAIVVTAVGISFITARGTGVGAPAQPTQSRASAPSPPLAPVGTTLEEGTYRLPALEPEVTVTLPAGWLLELAEARGVLLNSRLDGDLATASILRPSGVGDPETEAPTELPDDLGAWLAQHPHLDVTATRPATLGGGSVAERLSARSTYEAGSATGASLALLFLDGGPANIEPGMVYEFVIGEVGGETIVILTSVPLRRQAELITMTNDLLPRIEIEGLDGG